MKKTKVSGEASLIAPIFPDAVVGASATKIIAPLLAEIARYDRDPHFGLALGGGPKDPYARQIVFPVAKFIVGARADTSAVRTGAAVCASSLKGLQLATGSDLSDGYIEHWVYDRVSDEVINAWDHDQDLDTDELIADLRKGIKIGLLHPRTDVASIIEETQERATLAKAELAEAALKGPDAGAGKPVPPDWPEYRGNTPTPKSAANLRSYTKRMGTEFRLNEHTQEIHVTGIRGRDRLDDGLLSDLALGMCDLGCDVPLDFFQREVGRLARSNPFNPAKEYFDAQQKVWDGVERLSSLFVRYAGADDTSYVREVGIAFGVTLVRRIRHPGCPLYGFPILEGYVGGEGKSQFARILAGSLGFTDCLPLGATPKQVIEETRGIAVVEFSELVGLGNRENEQIKSMVTRTTDMARTAYARLPSSVPRAFAMIGTTNSPAYLRGGGGLRRFWPIKVGAIDLDALRRDRDQLLGEASALEARGVSNNIPESVWMDASQEQQTRVVSDPIEDALEDIISGVREGFIPNTELRSALEEMNLDWDRASRSGAVARVMVKGDFKSTRLRKPGSDERARGYLRGSSGAAAKWYQKGGGGLRLDKAMSRLAAAARDAEVYEEDDNDGNGNVVSLYDRAAKVAKDLKRKPARAS